MFRVYLELPRPHEPLHGLHLVEAGVGVPGVGLRGHGLRLGGDGPQQGGEQQQQLGHGVCRAEAGPALDTASSESSRWGGEYRSYFYWEPTDTTDRGSAQIALAKDCNSEHSGNEYPE